MRPKKSKQAKICIGNFLSSIGGEEAKAEEETDLLLRDFDDCQFISLFSLSRIFCRISFEKSQNWNKTFSLQPCFHKNLNFFVSFMKF